MTGGRLLIECLIAQGVKVIFGIPGNQLTPAYEALYHRQDAIQHVLARHESGAAFMADGYARSTGQIGVCVTIPGPGASNAHVGLGEASTDCVPVLLITSQNESRFAKHDPTKMFHGLDQKQALAPVTKAMESVHRAQDIPAAVSRIFSALRSDRPRPAFLEFTSDSLAADVASEIPDFAAGSEPEIPDLTSLHEMLADAERPLIIAGAGIHHAGAHQELKQLAEDLSAPVLTTILGKGALADDHPLSIGRSRSGIAREALESTDLLLAVGTRFTQMDTGGWSMQLPDRWVHIEADPNQIGSEYEPTLGIAGNPKSVLQALLETQVSSACPAWQEQTRHWRQQLTSVETPPLFRTLRDVLPRDAIVSVDVHMTGYAMHRHFDTYVPGTFLYPGIYIAMGYGLPAAIGAKFAHPDRTVVALAGDASFLMSSMELATIAHYKLPVITIISNDNSLTSIRGSQERQFGTTLGIEVTNPDLVAYAHACGIQAQRVRERRAFGLVLQAALAANEPFLMELTPQVFR